MSTPLARITASLTAPRGPDVRLRVNVDSRWLEQGALLEITLPRNVCCAGCDGGGCDACHRSGAVTLRGRGEPASSVRVTVPPRTEPSSGSMLTLRIPEQGGASSDDPSLPRGLLMLTLAPGASSDPGVIRVDGEELPPAAAPRVSLAAERLAGALRLPPVLLGVGVLMVALLLGFVFAR